MSEQEHYAMTPEPIDVIDAWDLNFNAGNVLKYISRYKRKGDPLGDLLKAKKYIQYEIDKVRREENRNTNERKGFSIKEPHGN